MAKPGFEVRKLECDAFDIRVVDRHIAAGRVSREDVAKNLANLPDLVDNAAEIVVGLSEGEGADETTVD